MIRKITPCLLLCLSFFVAVSAYADQVAPSDRVTSRLNVRQGPGTETPIVGKLQPGETADLLSSVPRWFEIRLSDGTHGYVSKSWSTVIPSPAPTAGKFIRLGSWNLKKLGHGSTKDYATIRTIIDQNFDVMAVVEVMQKGGGHPGYNDLMSGLGSGWGGVVTDSPRPNTTSGSAEFYAVVYRKSVARVCDGWTGIQYFPDGDGSPGSTGSDLFAREPAYTCIAIVGSNATVRTDFMLADYHATWDDGDEDIIRAEVSHIDSVFSAMAGARPGKKTC